MIEKLILTVLVALTINMGIDRPEASMLPDTWESETSYSESDYSEDAYYSEDMDLLFDLAINGADWVGASTSVDEIQEALVEITLNEELEIAYAYYGSAEGDFFMFPDEELPEGYDFRERPVYLNAVEEEIYYAEPYTDAISGRQIQTIGITVYDENGFVGVLGIDAYID